MEYKISVQKDRASRLVSELGKQVEVLNEEGGFTQLRVTIEHTGDVLSLFHAGIMHGLDIAFDHNKTQKS